MKKKTVCLVVAILLMALTILPAYAASYSQTYHATNVRHYFNTTAVSKDSGSWSSARDYNSGISYYNNDTHQTISSGCQQWFYVVTGAGDPISGQEWTNSGSSSSFVSITTSSASVKLRIYNPNYVSNSTVPWRLNTDGSYTGYAY